MKITEIPAKPKEQKIVRVAAYARVSADKDAAFHSLEAQTEYYENYVEMHPDWELIGIYSDNGISGTTINRPEFQRMLEDCRFGKIDLVVTKSVTRFARNTVILLETVRELKKLGIDCYFEKEDMHSISPDGELLLTLLAMYAEEEARSASENQKWRIRKKFENGEPWVGNMLGYRLVNGRMVIVPEEAEIVRRIFSDYLSGMGRYVIARQLILEGIRTASGNKWTESSIYQILTNEKYKGDALLQKTYTVDYLTKEVRRNDGEVRQYLVQNSHDPIIDPAIFDQVQERLRKRSAYRIKIRDNSPFSTRLICGDCGGFYGHKVWHNHANTERYDVWYCNQKYSRAEKCQSPVIREEQLWDAFRTVLAKRGETNPAITEEHWREIVESVTVYADRRMAFLLADGTELEITLSK